MLVRHLMSADVFALAPETSAIDALRALRERRVRRAPILSAEDQLIGWVTESDLVRITPGTIGQLEDKSGQAASLRPVGTLSKTSVHTVSPDDHIEDVARLFLEHRIGGVPVVRRGTVVGMITESDVFRAVANAAQRSTSARVTVQRSRAETVAPALDAVASLGLELTGLTEYPLEDGRPVLVLRVRGARSDELGAELTRTGWTLLDRRPARPAAAPRRRAS